MRDGQRHRDAARALAAFPSPVVAAIAGHAPAGGCVLALCCDYRIMASGPFRIGLNETQVGLVAPEGIQHLLRRVVGLHRAERLLQDALSRSLDLDYVRTAVMSARYLARIFLARGDFAVSAVLQ